MELNNHKTRAIVLGLFAVIVAFALSYGTYAQSTKAITEWTVPTPNSQPAHVTPSAVSIVLFTEMAGSKIGQLNPTKNTIIEWTLPGNVSPHGIDVLGGKAVFAEEIGRVASLDTSRNLLSEWHLRNTPTSPVHVVPQGSNTVFFTDAGANSIGMLNVSTNVITEWAVPTANAALNGITITKKGLLWFAEGAGKIAVLDPVMNTISEVTLPLGATGASSPGHVFVVNPNQVYFNDAAANTLGRFNTTTNVLTEWTVPTVSSVPASVLVVPGMATMLQFDEMAGNNVGTLDTTKAGSTSVVAPVVTAVTPTTVTLLPSQTTVNKSTTHVTPVLSTVTGVVTGAFTEYAVPTASSAPLGMGQLSSTRAIVFAESAGNKIAQIK